MAVDIDLVRDVLDKQLVDMRQKRMGKADGVILVLEGDGPPRVKCIEAGTAVLLGRISGRLEKWFRSLRRFHAPDVDPFRIPWHDVRSVGITVGVDFDGEKMGAFAWEDWLREHVVSKIPGGG